MGKIWDLDEYKGKTALIDDYGGQIKYDVLKSETDIMAERIGHRCLLFTLCRNEIGSVVGYTAFINHGIVPVMLNSHLEDKLLENLLKIYKPEYLWIPKDQVTRFPDMAVEYEAYGYLLVRTGYEVKYPLYEELGLLISTSGSTGSPKLVRQSYTNVFDNARSIALYLNLDDTERPITTLPMNYVYGLSIINSHFMVGATILLTDKGLMQREFWSFFREQEATSFGGVPYTYEMLDKLRFYRMDLPSLRTMTQAGGKLDPELHEKYAKYAEDNGKKFVVMYGAAEATARMGYLPPERALDKIGSMGIPIPGGKFSLVSDEDIRITEPLTVGELIYEGSNVTLGYSECGEDLIRGDDRHGVLKTGDMAQFDPEGYYYIVGRKKRFLKIYGNRVNLDEIERMITGTFDIEAACKGVDDHMEIYMTGYDNTKKIRDYIVSKTGLNPSAFSVMVTDGIPRNESGKILYSELHQ